MTAKFEHAVVMGASITGLLAARALSETFERVTVIDRDRLPESGEYRSGVPQSRHLHTLLVRGQQILDELFPGFSNDIAASGAPEVEWGVNHTYVTPAGLAQTAPTGIKSNQVTRAELEWLVRHRVMNLPNVRFLSETEVSGLITSADHRDVMGVYINARGDQHTTQMLANLVVDASGRKSKLPDWLREMGYDAPAETVVNAHTGYATRWYTMPEAGPHDWAIVVQTRPAEKLYRGGGLMQMEGGRWVVTLLGANGDYPPTDEQGFMDYARSLASPMLYEAIKDAEPITPIYGYRKLENVARHYERLTRRPENLIVMGDAAIALNPIYGQGMSKSAMEALLLRDLLAKTRDLRGFAATFQKRLPRVSAGAWMMATAEDMRYPAVEGALPGLVMRMSHAYLDMVIATIASDVAIGRAFVEVLNLMKPPTYMLRPDIAARVFGAALRRRFTRRTPRRESGEFTPAQAS
ncbi:MAG: FAD-dependent monooxygenase [Anaerolineae bacterium]|nr:FAD-dependent monooxygenase [Anaerolineae bacterium]